MNARNADARLVIAIDGPSGSGKSSVSKEVARRFGLAYLDTGAMYRAVTWWCLDSGADLDDPDAVVGATRTVPLELGTDPDEEHILVNGEDVRAAIRGDLVTDNVSKVSTTVAAREILVRMQQDVIRDSGYRIVAEGRDITTVVAPDADVRILLTASEAARLARRGRQLGAAASSNLEAQVVGRDAKDSTVVNFTQAQDGVQLLDSSELSMEQTVQGVIDLVIRATDTAHETGHEAHDETGATAPEETRQP
ncbi:(d)CMP kinase [Kocuria sp.]|uniref:(d)CMP kinase n=1 Tax=Kocuria sp. TaxID=1871328 RepID=UPI0026DABC82|nr:(d)CMP kinase [Kocuria sp.]MDO4919892.1 (d)CMP kinase [Kocuria sp.]